MKRLEIKREIEELKKTSIDILASVATHPVKEANML